MDMFDGLLKICKYTREYGVSTIVFQVPDIDREDGESDSNNNSESPECGFLWKGNLFSSKMLLISIVELAVTEAEQLLKSYDKVMRDVSRAEASACDEDNNSMPYELEAYFHVDTRRERGHRRRENPSLHTTAHPMTATSRAYASTSISGAIVKSEKIAVPSFHESSSRSGGLVTMKSEKGLLSSAINSGASNSSSSSSSSNHARSSRLVTMSIGDESDSGGGREERIIRVNSGFGPGNSMGGGGAAAAAASGSAGMMRNSSGSSSGKGGSGGSISMRRAKDTERVVHGLMYDMFVGLDYLLSDADGFSGGGDEKSEKSEKSLPNSCDTFLNLLIKMYKVLVRVTKGLIERKCKRFSDEFTKLIPFINDSFCGKINKLIEAVHNFENLNKSMKSKVARLVPELIFSMEQLDHSLIKLDSSADKSLLKGNFLKKSALRDFKVVASTK